MSGITMILISSRFPPPLRFVCLVVTVLFFALFSFFFKPLQSNVVFVAFCARSFASQWKLIAVETRKRAISCCSVHILFNIFHLFRDHQEMLWDEWSPFFFTYFIIMTIYLFHCDELYDCLNFAGLDSMRGRWYCLAERGNIFLCVSSWIKCKLQYFLYFYAVRIGDLDTCMGGRYLLIGHCFLKRLVAPKRAVLLVGFG